MITFLCKKLARDKTQENFKSQDISITCKMLSGDALQNELKNKLIEECTEVKDAGNKQELIAELADVLEVIDGLCKAYDISAQDVQNIKAQKHTQRGGFEQGLFIDTIIMHDDNPNAHHFRLSPDRYPEVEEVK
jgi:predicted house-cleaning noncanonical NTP pyrophosphatase (MazG superfamily)